MKRRPLDVRDLLCICNATLLLTTTLMLGVCRLQLSGPQYWSFGVLERAAGPLSSGFQCNGTSDFRCLRFTFEELASGMGQLFIPRLIE